MSAHLRYQEWMPEVCAAMARLGAIDAEMAKACGVTLRTFRRWKTIFPELAEAVAGGKDLADARVAASLYNMAVGFKETVRRVTRQGTVVEVDFFVAPEIAAIALWLCNRRPDLWRHVNRVEHTGPNGGPIEVSDADRKKAEDKLTEQILAAAEEITRESSEG